MGAGGGEVGEEVGVVGAERGEEGVGSGCGWGGRKDGGG